MDKIFKIGLLVLGFSYLVYLFFPIANHAGRYSFRQVGKSITILDTANADVYRSVSEVGTDGRGPDAWYRVNPKTGNVAIISLKKAK